MRDFPNDVLKEMAMDPAQPAKGPWTVTLHPYLYRKFLEYCPDRARRWNAYRARVNLGSGEYDDNSYCGGHVKEIRVQRKDQAAILGYSSYVDLSMEMKMAANVENVHSMIACLLPKGIYNIEKVDSYVDRKLFLFSSQRCPREGAGGSARVRRISWI